MTVGLIGLGRMGTGITTKLHDEGHEVCCWNRTPETAQKLKKDLKKLDVLQSIDKLVQSLPKPRIIWIMVPHTAVDEILAQVKKYVEKGDVVIDGGNSHYLDSEKRFKSFEKLGVHFLGIGTSGGILAADNGYPFMVGGSFEGYKIITPILNSLSRPGGGHEYFGKGGAGHFVKMVHNGIEYGIMQSLGEGFEVLEKSAYKFDLLKIASLWQKGTLVSGFLLNRAKDALSKNQKLDDIVGVIDASGEAQWTIDTAKEEGVNVEIIERSLEYRKRSKIDQKIQQSFTAKMIAALRQQFGGHSIQLRSKASG